MIVAISIFVGILLLGAAGLAIFAMLVLGIHMDEHARRLDRAPATRIQSVTRRILGVGARIGDPVRGKQER